MKSLAYRAPRSGKFERLQRLYTIVGAVLARAASGPQLTRRLPHRTRIFAARPTAMHQARRGVDVRVEDVSSLTQKKLKKTLKVTSDLKVPGVSVSQRLKNTR